MLDVKRSNPNNRNSSNQQTFSCVSLYSKLDAQKLSAIVGFQRASIMINSSKSVHMFMVEDNKT